MEAGDLIELAPHSETILSVKLTERVNKITLPFEVMNTLVSPKEHATISLEASVKVENRLKQWFKELTDS